MDAVLNVLRGMRLTGGVFLEADFTAPWCVTSQVTPHDYRPAAPVPRQVIAYHYLTAGSMLLKVGDQPPLRVAQGELVVMPRNEPHVIGSTLTIRPVGEEHLVTSVRQDGLVRIVHGGGGERTSLLCGYLGDETSYNPVLAMLPSVMKIDVADGAAGRWMESSLRLAAQELARGQGGAPEFLGRLAELLFTEVVRRHLASQPSGARGWEAGLQDPAVARALGLLHGQIARRWTTDALAEDVGMSRSAFADRFTRVVGEPPMRYLARQRLAQACRLLKETAGSIAEIAYAVGYESEASFSRAFRRAHGTPPAAWRHETTGKDRTPAPGVSPRR